MNAAQADRRVIAARAAQTQAGKRVRVRPVRTSNQAAYQGKPRKSPRMTATQRDSMGRVSAWARSPYAPKGGWR